MSYETHVTVPVPDPNIYGLVLLYDVIGREYDWKTSKITDADTGTQKFYFTRHDNSIRQAKVKLNELTDCLRDRRIKILREKIELIVFDTKNKVGY